MMAKRPTADMLSSGVTVQGHVKYFKLFPRLSECYITILIKWPLEVEERVMHIQKLPSQIEYKDIQVRAWLWRNFYVAIWENYF